ncbi:MFS transporter [Microbacterium sp. BH-3-3-3]|uniref:MFS transporter n=1 Tax=Microbacterium sp. BH-3-3-3 TaxID=1906742 RepID=UPI0016428006|nr:MFS transporter [Microbacterium sp. BH-3-3-3]
MSRIVTSVHRTSPRARDGKPSLGFLITLVVAVAAVNGTLLSNAILTLSLKSAAIDAAGATTVLSIVVGIGSVFSLIGYPVFGRLSDRTLAKIGRRRPYLFAGAALLALGAVVTVVASNVPVLTLGWIITTLGAVSALVGATALVPDQVAAEHRGPASAMLGLGSPLGAIVGIFLAQLMQPNLAAMIFLPAAVSVVAVLVLAFTISDVALARQERPPFLLREFLATFWVNPVRHSAYGWAWWSRFMIFVGVAAVNAYQAFYLIIVHHIDPATVGTAILVAGVISTALSMIFAPLLAKVSDRVGRRKPFVIASAVVFAIGLGLTAMATTYPMFLIAVAVIGIGQGVYFAVDYALVMDVLPDAKNPAKDLGIMNLANALPPTLVTAVAPALLSIGASATNPQNFTALFLAGAAAAVVGAILIVPIRGVK